MKKGFGFIFFIILTLFLTPTYVIRFGFLGLPDNLLMLWVFFLWIIWLCIITYQNRWQELYNFVKNFDKKLLVLILVFFLAGLLSVFIGGFDVKKLGQFTVLFLQPLSLFFIAAFHFNHAQQNKNYLLVTTYFLLAIAGLYGILQYFTLLGLPPLWWGNSVEPKLSHCTPLVCGAVVS